MKAHVLLGALLVSCSSSSGGPSASQIVGEWQFDQDGGGPSPCMGRPGCSFLVAFDSNGTAGDIVSENGQRSCATTWQYSFDGKTLIEKAADGGSLGFSPSQVTFSGDTMTISTTGYPTQLWTRVNSSGTNTCP